MTESKLLERIVVNPAVMVGKPVIRGTRLSVEYVLNRLGHGSTIDELIEEYGRLTAEDVLSCLIFASKAISEVDFVPRVVSCGAGRPGTALENPCQGFRFVPGAVDKSAVSHLPSVPRPVNQALKVNPA